MRSRLPSQPGRRLPLQPGRRLPSQPERRSSPWPMRSRLPLQPERRPSSQPERCPLLRPVCRPSQRRPRRAAATDRNPVGRRLPPRRQTEPPRARSPLPREPPTPKPPADPLDGRSSTRSFASSRSPTLHSEKARQASLPCQLQHRGQKLSGSIRDRFVRGPSSRRWKQVAAAWKQPAGCARTSRRTPKDRCAGASRARRPRPHRPLFPGRGSRRSPRSRDRSRDRTARASSGPAAPRC